MTEQRRVILERVRAGLKTTAHQISHLRDTVDVVEQGLIHCAGEQIEQSISSRLALLKPIGEDLEARGVTVELSALWSHYLPLASLIASWASIPRRCIGGIVGLPGAGKSTLTKIVHAALTRTLEKPVAVVSLDDFYFTPEQRESLGFRWRAMPGTHDLTLLSKFLNDARASSDLLSVPRYDTRIEQRPPNKIVPMPHLILIEGWFVGARVPGYEMLADVLDFLVYMEMGLEAAHRSRLLREEKIRLQSNNIMGMSAEETECFWQDAILPTATNWVIPLKSQANLTLKVDEHYCITGLECRGKGV